MTNDSKYRIANEKFGHWAKGKLIDHKNGIIFAAIFAAAVAIDNYVDTEKYLDSEEMTELDETLNVKQQEILNNIKVAASTIIANTDNSCGVTVEGKIAGDDPVDGPDRALTILRNAFPDNAEFLKILQFFDKNNIKLHLTSGNIDDTYAVFYNSPDNPEETVLILQGGYFSNDNIYAEQLNKLVKQIVSGDLLEKKGVTLIFKNEYSKIEPFLDTWSLPYSDSVDDFFLNPKDPKSKIEVIKVTWENPCGKETTSSIVPKTTIVPIHK